MPVENFILLETLFQSPSELILTGNVPIGGRQNHMNICRFIGWGAKLGDIPNVLKLVTIHVI